MFSHIMKNAKLRTKLLFSHFLIVFGAVIPISLIFTSRNTEILLRQMNQFNELSFLQICDNINREIEKYNSMADNLSAEPAWIGYLSSDSGAKTPDERYLAYARLLPGVKPKFDIASQNGEGITFYTWVASCMPGSYIKIVEPGSASWLREAEEAFGLKTMGNPDFGWNGSVTVPLCKAIVPGVVLRIDIPESQFSNVYYQHDSGKDYYVVNHLGKVVSSSKRLMIGKNIVDVEGLLINQDVPFYVAETERGISTLFCATSNPKGMQGTISVICIISPDEMLLQLDANRMLSTLTTIAVMLLASVFILFLSSSMTRRLDRLSASISLVRDGNFTVSIDTEGSDEIGRLGLSFKEMIGRMDQLFKQVYKAEAQIKELEMANKDARLRMLYSQINPHFMFNVMESVRMRLVRIGEREVSVVVKNFAKLMRKSIEWKNDDITLEQELELLESYLSIQKFRFSSTFSYHIDAELGLDAMVPKFTLQPIAENCFVHGFKNSQGVNRIDVRIWREGGAVFIEISDNGEGMSAERLEKLKVELDDNGDGASIGLRNVNQRLKLTFGPKHCLSVESGSSGTKVRISIPGREA
ncbi:MAG: sensor histidine kinase [Clostridiales bacterium]|jgi:sensor histidine kinase YesM|nr:sensor histidine kinase [Clostridiales bacterium]